MNLNPFSRPSLTLSIEDGSLRILVVRRGRVHSWMSYPLDQDVFKDGVVLSPALFQNALSSLFFLREGIRGNISVCLPGSRSFFRTVTLPRLKPKLIAEAMQREAQRELPVDAQDVQLFWDPFSPNQGEQDFLLVGMQKDAYGRLHKGLRGARITPRMWDLKPLALVRAVSRKNVVIVDVALGSTDLIVVTRGVPRLVRSVVEPSDLGPQERGQALAEQVGRTIAYSQANSPEETWDPKTPIVLTGARAGDLEMVQALKTMTSYPLEPFLCPIPSPPDFTPAMYAATLGVAMKSKRSSWIGRTAADFEILGGGLRPTGLMMKRAAATLLLAAGMAALVPSAQAKKEQQDQIGIRRAEVLNVQRQLSATRTGLAAKAQLQSQIDSIVAITTALQAERKTIATLGRDINGDITQARAAAPALLDFNKYFTLDDSLVIEGVAPNTAMVLDYARLLEQTGRFSSVAVTGLLQRDNGDSPPTAGFVLVLSKPKPAANQ